SFARQNAKTPRDFYQAMECVEACMKIVWKCRKEGSLKWWALENPVGYLRQFLGRPSYTFQHWEFDKAAAHCKPTDLWGYFNPPVKKVKRRPEISKDRNKRMGNWQKPTPPPGYEHITDRSAIRAITPEGFANAFFKA